MKKQIKGFLAGVIVTVLVLVCFTVMAETYEIGDIIGNILYTDIVTYFDGEKIDSFNLNGQTGIIVENLRNYGFDVVWDGEERKLYANVKNTQDTAEWVNEGYEGEHPHREIEYRYVNGIKTNEFRYTGRKRYVEDCRLCNRFDFRKTRWGMSLDQVKKSEESELFMEKENSIVYSNLEVAGFNTYLSYDFNDQNELYQGVYLFNEDHTFSNSYVEDYTELKSNMVELYGQPAENDIVWKNDYFKSDTSKWGIAVSLGHLVYYSCWEIEDTCIYLSLNGDNYKIKLALSYYSKDLMDTVKPDTDGL